MTISCEPSISDQTGDPLLIITWAVTDPDKVGWTISISYRNGMGDNQRTVSGKGSKTVTEIDYGLDPGQMSAGCVARVQ